MDKYIQDFLFEFQRHKGMADRALAALEDSQFFERPGGAVNPPALIVKHLAGNLRSRWTDFLTTDGEKPDRDRDREFVLTERDTRASLLAAWERGWAVLFATVESLRDDDLDRTVTIRGEGLTARQALLRGLGHAAYHVGQITYLSRLFQPDSAWLTIAPGTSAAARGEYLARKDEAQGDVDARHSAT